MGELKTFQSLLDDTPDTFHCTRTARSLQYHWALMRHMCLLCDQDGEFSEEHWLSVEQNIEVFAGSCIMSEDHSLLSPVLSTFFLPCICVVGYIPADGNLASFAEWMEELEDGDLM